MFLQPTRSECVSVYHTIRIVARNGMQDAKERDRPGRA